MINGFPGKPGQKYWAAGVLWCLYTNGTRMFPGTGGNWDLPSRVSHTKVTFCIKFISHNSQRRCRQPPCQSSHTNGIYLLFHIYITCTVTDIISSCIHIIFYSWISTHHILKRSPHVVACVQRTWLDDDLWQPETTSQGVNQWELRVTHFISHQVTCCLS